MTGGFRFRPPAREEGASHRRGTTNPVQVGLESDGLGVGLKHDLRTMPCEDHGFGIVLWHQFELSGSKLCFAADLNMACRLLV